MVPAIPTPSLCSALEQRLPEDLPAVLIIAFLGNPLGSKAMRNAGFTSAHHYQLGKELPTISVGKELSCEL